MEDFTALMRGARNCVEFLGVKKNENVLLLTETTTNPTVVQALLCAIEEVGAEALTMVMKPIVDEEMKLPRALVEAWKASDALIALVSAHPKAIFGQTNEFYEVKKLGKTRSITLHGMATVEAFSTAAQFPLGLEREIAKRAYERVRQSRLMRVTDPKGTDVSGKIEKRYVWGLPGKGFPLGAIIVEPIVEGDGVIYVDGMMKLGWLKTPIKLTIKNNRVEEIEGGFEAEWLKNYIHGVENAQNLAEMAFGLNPKGRIPFDLGKYLDELTRRAGVVHVSMGRAVCDEGCIVPSKIHLPLVIVNPTVYLDEEPIVERGKLLILEDPEIIKIAERYGDPKKLLSPS